MQEESSLNEHANVLAIAAKKCNEIGEIIIVKGTKMTGKGNFVI